MAVACLPAPCYQHVVQPVVTAQPSYRGHILQSILANKPRSPPDSAGSATLVDLSDGSEKCSTPYRLPRISPRTPTSDDGIVSPDVVDEKVWGRFGYEDVVRMPELGPSVHKALINSPAPVPVSVPASGVPGLGVGTVGQRSVAAGQRYRQTAMLVPKFRSAAVTPSLHAAVIRDEEDVHVYKSLLEKAANADHTLEPTPTPVPGSRSASPAKSTRSIHWALGSTRHPLFDYKGRSRKQGPYSREFTVRCMAPASWMRMKWGRTRTLVH